MSTLTITARTVYDTVSAALEGVGYRGGVYVGHVPDALPTFPSGAVMEYCAVWPRVPVPVDDTPVSDLELLDGRVFVFQTSLVSTDMDTVLDMTDATTVALTNLQVGGGVVRRYPELEPGQVLPDTEVSPTRFVVPLIWGLSTQ